MNTNIEVLRELDELVEAARLLGVTQAKKLFGEHTEGDRRFERAMYESIDKHRAALVRMAEGRYHPCTHILIDGLKRLEGGTAVLAEWDRARAQADAALAAQTQPKRRPYNASASLSEYGVFPECDAQQPAAVDGSDAQAAEIEALRAEVDALREALVQIDALDQEGHGRLFCRCTLRILIERMGAIARAALKETPAYAEAETDMTDCADERESND